MPAWKKKNSALLNECRQLYQRQKAIDQIISTYSYWKKINRSDYEFTITLPSKHLSIPLPPPGTDRPGATLVGARTAAQLFIKDGFQPERVEIGGGVNEISHVGNAAFNARYKSFSEFEQKFRADFNLQIERMEHSGGWFSYIDYSYVRIELQDKDDYLLKLTVPASGRGVGYELSVPNNYPLSSLAEILLLVDPPEDWSR